MNDQRYIGGYDAELSRIAEAAIGGVIGYNPELGKVIDHDAATKLVRTIVERPNDECLFPNKFPATAIRIFRGVVQAMKP